MTEELAGSQEPEAPSSAPETPVESKSMDDTILETYRALTTEEEKPARVRDETGKFVSTKEPEPEAPAEVAPEPKPYDKYPSSWRKEIAAHWEKTPAELREEIHRREQNFLDGIKGYKEPAEFGKSLGQELNPYLDTFRQFNTTPQAVIRDLMPVWKTLLTGSPQEKQAAYLNIAKNFGIQSASVPAAPQQASGPQSSELMTALQRVDALERELKTFRQETTSQKEAQDQAEASAQIAKFAANPQNEFYEQVRGDMSKLLLAGTVDSLEKAYEMAVWANPEVRAKLLEKQESERRKREAAEAAAARKAAAANVRPRGTPPTLPTRGSMEDTIRETARSLGITG
jgi:hypothetical protein